MKDQLNWSLWMGDNLQQITSKYCGKKFIFQQNKASIHASMLTQTFFQSRNLKVMKVGQPVPQTSIL